MSPPGAVTIETGRPTSPPSDNPTTAKLHPWQDTGLKLGGISRSLVFQLWSSGTLASVKIGRRRFSTDAQIADYIRRLEAGAA